MWLGSAFSDYISSEILCSDASEDPLLEYFQACSRSYIPSCMPDPHGLLTLHLISARSHLICLSISIHSLNITSHDYEIIICSLSKSTEYLEFRKIAFTRRRTYKDIILAVMTASRLQLNCCVLVEIPESVFIRSLLSSSYIFCASQTHCQKPRYPSSDS